MNVCTIKFCNYKEKYQNICELLKPAGNYLVYFVLYEEPTWFYLFIFCNQSTDLARVRLLFHGHTVVSINRWLFFTVRQKINWQVGRYFSEQLLLDENNPLPCLLPQNIPLFLYVNSGRGSAKFGFWFFCGYKEMWNG